MTRNKIMVLLDMLMEHSELGMVQIGNLDVIYNPYMNGGEWEVFDHDSDHTEYSSFEAEGIIECADMILMVLDSTR